MQGGQESSDNWLMSSIKNKAGQLVGTFLLDMAGRGDSRLPWLVYLTFAYKNRPLPSSPELDRFEEVDRIIQALCAKHSARNVAIWTRAGVRDWIVYAQDGGSFGDVALAALRPFAVQIEVQADGVWKQYQDFLEMLTLPNLDNRHRVANLWAAPAAPLLLVSLQP